PSMYDSLKRHALPVNVKAVRAFAGSARKLDLYFWLGYRMHNIDRELVISWQALAEQFGEGYTRDRAFKHDFDQALADIKDVFPKLPVMLDEHGIHLRPADTDVLALPAPRKR
ncbi:MAG: replication protein RepA, partial [Hyphomicrobium sp.]